MCKIIGRDKECRELKDILDSGKSEFVVVYGRRRIGKTFLVREFFDNKFAFYHTGLSPFELKDENLLEEQLKSFGMTLARFGAEMTSNPKSWLEAFEILIRLLESKKGKSRQIVFIDEMPWMDTPRSGFITAFEHFWNGWAAGRNNLILIVCGSATSWINDTLINNHGGLFDRVTRTIHLSPFELKSTGELLKANGIQTNEYDLLQSQMVFGGVPFYISNLRKDFSMAQNIDRMFFDSDAKLKNEFSRLFASSFKNAEMCEKIVRTLFKRKYGYTRDELAKTLGTMPGGSLSKLLDGLESSGFILAYKNLRDKRKVYYKLIDSFCLFWLSFIDGKKTNDRHYWQNSQNSPALDSWRGLAFENLCFSHSDCIRQALGIGGVNTEVSTWLYDGDDEHKGAQIDMVLTRADNIINLCEMKFSKNEFSVNKEYDKRIRERDCIRQALGIGGVNTEVSTWLYDGDDEHKGAQIDMVLTRADNIINLCEMKFSKNEFSVNKEYDKRIRERTETFREVEKTRKVIHNTLITTYGLKRNAYSDQFQSVVTASQLMV